LKIFGFALSSSVFGDKRKFSRRALSLQQRRFQTMKRCQKCGHENDDAMRFCLECGTPLADAPIVINWQDGGTQKQSNVDTASFGQTKETQIRPNWNYQPQQPPSGFGAPPQKPRSNKKLFVVIGGIFALFLLVFGAGAAIIGYNIMFPPKPSPTPVPTPTVSPTVSPTRSPKPSPSPSVSPTTDEDEPPPPPSNKTNTGTAAKFERMWVDYNVTEGGRRGMRIHTSFRVFDLKNQSLYLAIYFQKKDGTKLLTDDRNFRSTNGQVAIFKPLRPAYDDTVYDDATLFMPYEELNLDPGFYELQMDADVIYENGDLVEHLNFYDFEYEKE
jgi:hypothetical protein